MVALIACMVWIGVYPKPFFDMIEEPVNYVVQKVDPGYFATAPTGVGQALLPVPAAAQGQARVPVLHTAEAHK
jgi:methenyltetrahydromethanopterin cyclohydrolase